MTDPHPLLAFLDRVERAPDAIARRKRSYELLGVRPGAKVVDAGCGAGTAVRELAALVTATGEASGVDVSEALLATAVERATHEGVSATFHAVSATALPFATGSLDAYRAERLYQHLSDAAPALALAEAHRVLAPGGRIALVDQDWDAIVLDSDDTDKTRRVLRAFSDGIANGAAARRFHRSLREADFTAIEVFGEAVTSTSWADYGWFPELLAVVAEASGTLPSRDAATWLDDQRERGQSGRFFLTMVHLIGTARRS